jgi:hypothetical protein
VFILNVSTLTCLMDMKGETNQAGIKIKEKSYGGLFSFDKPLK